MIMNDVCMDVVITVIDFKVRCLYGCCHESD